jgi:hypothetical protein
MLLYAETIGKTTPTRPLGVLKIESGETVGIAFGEN